MLLQLYLRNLLYLLRNLFSRSMPQLFLVVNQLRHGTETLRTGVITSEQQGHKMSSKFVHVLRLLSDLSCIVLA